MRAQFIFLLSTLLAIVPLMNPGPLTGSSELDYRGSGRFETSRFETDYRGSGRLEMAYRGSGRLEMAYRGSGRITIG
jgi:hypothetical protein